MKRIEELIESARYWTKNSNYTYDPSTGRYTSGISTEAFLEAANDAQNHLQSLILGLGSNLFVQDSIINCVADQSEYTVPDRVFGGTNITSVQLSETGDPDDYGEPLPRRYLRDRRWESGTVSYYVPTGFGKIELVDAPSISTSKIKVAYRRELDDLDIRRGRVNAAPVGAAIVLSVSPPVPDAWELSEADYVCISNRYGVVMLRNGLVSSYNSGTRTLTLSANVSTYLVSPYVLADLTGGYVTCGAYTTTHSKLPDHCERYIRIYMQKRLMVTKGNNNSLLEDSELVKIEKEDILPFYSDEDGDVDEFPILDPEILY